MGKMISGMALAFGAVILIGYILWGELVQWDSSRVEDKSEVVNFMIPAKDRSTIDSQSLAEESETSVFPMVPDNEPSPSVSSGQ